MKATGMVRKIDDLGRMVMPKEIRDARGWQSGTPLEIFVDGENVVLKAYNGNLEDGAIRQLKVLVKETKESGDREALVKAIEVLERGIK
jgi:AbrB family looped-hinge helix DNA binding protein